MTTTAASSVQIEFLKPRADGDTCEEAIISQDEIMRVILKSSIIPAITEKQILEIVDLHPEKEEEIRKGIQKKEETTRSEMVLILTNKGSEKFYCYTKKVTEEITGKKLPILDLKVNGEIVASPTIREPSIRGIIKVVEALSWGELEEMFPEEDESVIFDR